MSDSNEWVIELSSPIITEPLRYTLTDSPLIIGRNDARNPNAANIDIGPYDAAKKGVSRQHVRLTVEGDQLMISDMDTSNGTVLNGQKLQGNRPQASSGSDTLVLGAFRLSLKIISRPDGADPTTPTRDSRTKTDKLTPKRSSILIVEDHVEVAQLFAMILQKKGYDTHISRDATRAMRFLQNKQPDAVILDMMLPGMNGTEVCRYIRRDSSLDYTAIIIVSANRNPGTERAAFDAGADAFVSKPVNAEELTKTVEKYIRMRKAGITDDQTRELSDRDVTKALEEKQILEMETGISNDTVAFVVSGYTDRPFTVTVNRPMTFGRGAYASPATHVDLSRFAAKDKGVSRMHARISRKDDTFFIEDLDSMNGTYINGEKLTPNQPTVLRSGYELRIGQLAMTVYFMAGKDQAATTPIREQGE